jgi:hypothetical protein
MFHDIIQETSEGVYPVFVVLTFTGTALSGIIRNITKTPYSHSSISFDTSMRGMYSFGRGKITKYNFLDAGFTREDLRDMKENNSGEVLYSIYVTFVTKDEKDQMIEKVEEIADKNAYKRLGYSLLGLLYNRLGIKYDGDDAFFCSQFVETILRAGGKGFDKKHPSEVRPYDYTKHKKFQFVMRGTTKNFSEDRIRSISSNLSSLNGKTLLFEAAMNEYSYLPSYGLKESGSMFSKLIREAVMDPNNFDKDGKIQTLEDSFKNDPVGLKVAYMVATSHEYDKPNIEAALSFVKNYKWEESQMAVDDIEGIDKPVNNEKVFEIATTIKAEGNNFPLVVVDKLHGITPQSEKKCILIDGHHRKESQKLLGISKTPIYKGTYTGDAEKLTEDLVLQEGWFGFSKKVSPTDEFYDLIDKVMKRIKTKMTPIRNAIWVGKDDDGMERLNELKKKEKYAVSIGFANFGPHIDTVTDSEKNNIASQIESVARESLESAGFKITDYQKLKNMKFVYSKDKSITGLAVFNDYPNMMYFDFDPKNLNESATELLEEAASKKLDIIPLTTKERAEVTKKYPNAECSFAKNGKNGMYFCYTDRTRSKFYPSPTAIPMGDVKFVSSTS